MLCRINILLKDKFMMRLKTQILFLFIFCMTASGLSAAETTPYHFLRFNSSARAAGLGGSFEAMSNDPTAVSFNPATIYTVEDQRFSTTFLKHVLDINSGVVTWVKPEFLDGTVAASVAYTNYGSFEYADKYGVQNGESFSANDLAMAVTYSNELDTNLFYGVTAKFIYVNIEEQSAVAAAMDVGLYYAIPDKRTNIGFSILNVGTELSSINGVSESLPLDIRFGLNHRLRGLPLLINVSLHHLADETDSFTDKLTSFSIGGEFYFGKYIRARAGFDNQTRRQTSPDTEKGLSGITAGFGIDTDMLQFDYGFSQVGTSAALHRFSIRFDID
jgi:hypothetical protein